MPFWTGSMLLGAVYPCELALVGRFEEHSCVAGAGLEFGRVTLFDGFVSDAATTTAEVD